MALFPFFFANKFKISPRPDSNTVNSINSSIRGVDLTIVSTVRSYFFDRRIDHILSAIGTYSSDGWNTHGTDGWIITNGNKTRVCRHNSCSTSLPCLCLLQAGVCRFCEAWRRRQRTKPSFVAVQSSTGESFGSYNIVFYGYSSDASVSWLLHYSYPASLGATRAHPC